MGDETPNIMNLDLNLGPVDPPSPNNELGSGSLPNQPMNLEEWIDGRVHQLREAVRQRTRPQRWRTLWRPMPIPPEARNIALELMVNSSSVGNGNGGAGTLQPGEGSVAAEERNVEVLKTCENATTVVEDEVLGKKEDLENGNGDEGSFYDCNICLDLARDPVVTCCGHLFCWPCLYRWLHLHSDAKECPVCKGEVTVKNLTPIYGRGNKTFELEEDLSLKIPLRPHAHRVESWRQTFQRNAFAIPMEEMIRRLGSRFDLTPDLVQLQPQNAENARDLPERNNSLLNRILTSRGLRREQSTVVPLDDAVELTQSSPSNAELGESRRLSSLLRRRSNAHRAATISNLTSALSSAERLVESYFSNQPVERNQEQAPAADDRDSMSSIAAIIQSETMLETSVEIDSTVSLATSSSRRRSDVSRFPDVDSGDSRAPRRRRLN